MVITTSFSCIIVLDRYNSCAFFFLCPGKQSHSVLICVSKKGTNIQPRSHLLAKNVPKTGNRLTRNSFALLQFHIPISRFEQVRQSCIRIWSLVSVNTIGPWIGQVVRIRCDSTSPQVVYVFRVFCRKSKLHHCCLVSINRGDMITFDSLPISTPFGMSLSSLRTQ